MTTHIWDGDQIVAETGERIGVYYRAGRELLAGETRMSMGVCTCLSDGHGNIVQMTVKSIEATNPYGAYIEGCQYDAYGNQTKRLLVGNPFRYCGEYTDLCSD